MNKESELSLAQLTELADVTSRTIRYYIAQGLLPPPVGGGPASRYSGIHLDRLRLIRELQRQHLPLAEIRNRLERLSDEEIAALAESHERRRAESPPESAVDYIRSVLSGRATAWSGAPVAAAPPAPAARTHGSIPAGEAAAAAVAPQPAIREVTPAYGEPAPGRPGTSAAAARSQWERIALAPDIELHVRRPLSRQQNRAVDRLIVVARQLLEEDQL